jgi:hypothetical protein
VDDLQIQPVGMAQVHGVGGIEDSPVYLVDLHLPMETTIALVRTTLGKLPAGTDVLIGMSVITLGDFVITNKNQKTKMSFVMPSQSDIDFVAMLKGTGRAQPSGTAPQPRRRSKR